MPAPRASRSVQPEMYKGRRRSRGSNCIVNAPQRPRAVIQMLILLLVNFHTGSVNQPSPLQARLIMKADIYQRITDQIVTAITAGAGEYRMPWHRQRGIGTPTNAITGRAYRGINTLLLWAEADHAGFRSG